MSTGGVVSDAKVPAVASEDAAVVRKVTFFHCIATTQYRRHEGVLPQI